MRPPRALAAGRRADVLVLAGGYADDVNDTLEINLVTLHEAIRRFHADHALQEA